MALPPVPAPRRRPAPAAPPVPELEAEAVAAPPPVRPTPMPRQRRAPPTLGVGAPPAPGVEEVPLQIIPTEETFELPPPQEAFPTEAIFEERAPAPVAMNVGAAASPFELIHAIDCQVVNGQLDCSGLGVQTDKQLYQGKSKPKRPPVKSRGHACQPLVSVLQFALVLRRIPYALAFPFPRASAPLLLTGISNPFPLASCAARSCLLIQEALVFPKPST